MTIQGKGFGETQGDVNLVLNTTHRRLSFQVAPGDWHDDEVHALLPQDISGVPDQPAALQLITRPRTTYRTTYTIDNASFHAARAEITLTSNLDRLVLMSSSSNWPKNPAVRSDGLMLREQHGSSIDCWAPGTDSLSFNPPAGWEVSGIEASFGRIDSGDGDGYGNSGSRVFTPGYGLGDWARVSVLGTGLWTIPVQWGVWRSHRSPSVGVADFIPYQITSVASFVVNIPGGSGSEDVCESDYSIAVHLIGPAGVSPY